MCSILIKNVFWLNLFRSKGTFVEKIYLKKKYKIQTKIKEARKFLFKYHKILFQHICVRWQRNPLFDNKYIKFDDRKYVFYVFMCMHGTLSNIDELFLIFIKKLYQTEYWQKIASSFKCWKHAQVISIYVNFPFFCHNIMCRYIR